MRDVLFSQSLGVYKLISHLHSQAHLIDVALGGGVNALPDGGRKHLVRRESQTRL